MKNGQRHMDMPPSVASFADRLIPLLHAHTDRQRLAAFVNEIVATERWNSFDRFAQTSKTLLARFARAGAETECHRIQTGVGIGNGHWVIQEAADIRAATVDLIRPERERIVDYRQNPWQVAQWSASTPKTGLICELVAIDSAQERDRLSDGSLIGKMVLTSLSPYRQTAAWAAKGAVGLLVDAPVNQLPEATGWAKFGWGGPPLAEGPVRLVGCSISASVGKRLRKRIAGQGPVRVKVKVDIRRYRGSHDVISGVVRGGADPQDEVWALAHSSEPGAVDNASGVAVCLEAAHVLEELIAAGAIARPKRSIRFLAGYECYGFFHYLEHVKRFQTPLAGICVDCVGVRPELCNGQLKLHRTMPCSAGFVDELSASLVAAAMREDTAGYTLVTRPFVSTEDTLLADPKYGFPCPWLANYPFTGYHSSADTPDLLHLPGLALSVAATAAYLYFLADADSSHIPDLASWTTNRAIAELESNPTPLGRETADLVRNQHAQSMGRLRRWLWGGDRESILAYLSDCEHRVADSATRNARSRYRSVAARTPAARELAAHVPRRRLPLAPTSENLWSHMAERFERSGLPKWAHYWADGQRNLRQITRLLSAESGRRVALDQTAALFSVLAELGYVTLHAPRNFVTRKRLVADLRALGIEPGMDLMVHSSLSAIGHVVGGAEAVIDALLIAVGKRGTLLMPSFNHYFARVYNPLTTPTLNGSIPNAMWQRPEAVRSLHGSHAVTAIGPRAEEWCERHLEVGIWAPESPIGRLVHEGGYVLGLGVDHRASTAYHIAETSMPCGCLDPFGSVVRIVAADGSVRQAPGLAWRAHACPVSPDKLTAAMDEPGLQRRGKVGHADCVLVKALDLYLVRRNHLRDACPRCTVKPRPRR